MSIAKPQWQTLCRKQDLVESSGVCVLNKNGTQIAIFYLPEQQQPLYALDNFDPISGANVLYRGILGSIDEELVVASPLYKQHYSLKSGQCLQQQDKQVTTYAVRLEGEDVQLLV